MSAVTVFSSLLLITLISHLSAGNVLSSVFLFNSRRALLIDFLHGQWTINCRLLQSEKVAYWSKKNIILLHGNVSAHTALLIRNKLEKIGWQIFKHPPYSPDLLLCDYFLFAPLKRSFERKRFGSNE